MGPIEQKQILSDPKQWLTWEIMLKSTLIKEGLVGYVFYEFPGEPPVYPPIIEDKETAAQYSERKGKFRKRDLLACAIIIERVTLPFGISFMDNATARDLYCALAKQCLGRNQHY